LVNISDSYGFIPEYWKKQYWKKAVITPISKCDAVVHASDFRSISVTSLLCRLIEKLMVEKLIIKTYLTSAFAEL